MPRNYSNTATTTTLSGAINAVTTSIVVASTTGFPAVDFILALEPGTVNQELVLVTAVAGTTLTVTRGYDNTTAVAHSTGAIVQHSHAAKDFKDSRDHEAATVAHGATGAVVGTTNAQTLTNKTLTLASNTLSGTKAQFNTALSDDDFATLTGTETLTNKSLTTPSIGGATLTKIQKGNATCAFTAEAGPVAVAVTFGSAFSVAPEVVLGSQHATTIFWATNITTTGFTLNARQYDTVARTLNAVASYIAMV